MKLCPRGRIFSHIRKCSAAGEAMLIQYGCGSCHALKSVREATGLVGPPLDASSACTSPTIRTICRKWIRGPQHVSPGTAMPDLNVGECDARDITAFLYTRAK